MVTTRSSSAPTSKSMDNLDSKIDSNSDSSSDELSQIDNDIPECISEDEKPCKSNKVNKVKHLGRVVGRTKSGKTIRIVSVRKVGGDTPGKLLRPNNLAPVAPSKFSKRKRVRSLKKSERARRAAKRRKLNNCYNNNNDEFIPSSETSDEAYNYDSMTSSSSDNSSDINDESDDESDKLTRMTNPYKSSDDSDFIDNDETQPGDDDPSKAGVLEAIMNDLLEGANGLADQKAWEKRDKAWRVNLTPREINDIEPVYNDIVTRVKRVPTIKDILTTRMPDSMKKTLVEKVLILENTPGQCFPHLNLKTEILDEIKKYQLVKLNEDQYAKFDEVEKQLNDSLKTTDLTGSNIDELPMKYRILGSDMPLKNKNTVFDKYKYSEMLSAGSEEKSKLNRWLECALRVPTFVNKLPVSISSGNMLVNEFLYNVRVKLDRTLYGMTNVKEEILFTLNNMITNPTGKMPGLTLVGPQGVGKTELAHCLAEAIGLPFAAIPMGGATGASHLAGHSFTYLGSRPGAIVDALHSMKQLNGILFLDEIDKISKSERGKEIAKMLLHITDTTQNHDFKDKFLGNNFSIDLSNIFFIYSLNYIDKLDRTLRDRLPIIKVEGYTLKEKVEITKQHLLPRAVANVGISRGDVEFDTTALEYLIKETDKAYNRETKSNGKSGVRQLKHAIEVIVKKINMLRSSVLEDGTTGNLDLSFSIKDFKLPFTITKGHIESLKVLANKETSAPPFGMYT
jgi:ATP-dependent Lon protease